MKDEAPPPIDGAQLLDWIHAQPEPERVYREAKKLGLSMHYPVPFYAWNTTQVVIVYTALKARARAAPATAPPRADPGDTGPVTPPAS